jgi:hypothetical protein
MPVSDTWKAITSGDWRSTGCSELHPPTAADAALTGELKGVGQKILEHLLQTLGIGGHAAGKMRVDLDLESQLPVFGLVTERPGDRIDQIGDEHLLSIHGNRSGLDLG